MADNSPKAETSAALRCLPPPAYDDGRVTVYHADARDVLPHLEVLRGVIVTDPPWANAPEGLYGPGDYRAEWAEIAALFPRIAPIVAVWLSCVSHPGMLSDVPPELVFRSMHWMRYAVPGYRNTRMAGADVLYTFGDERRPEGGKTVLPGECIASTPTRLAVTTSHPTPRSPQHARWVMRWLAHEGDTVIDPFAGSGVIVAAAKARGLRAIAIERDARWIPEIVRLVSQDVFELDAPRAAS